MSDLLRRDKYGRYAVGRNQGKVGIDYPLVRPSEDIRHLIADMWAVFDNEPTTAAALRNKRLQILWLFGFGDDPRAGVDAFAPTRRFTAIHSKDIVLCNTDGTILVDTTRDPLSGFGCTFVDTVLDNRLSLARWTSRNSPYVFDIGIVYHTAWNNELDPNPREYSGDLYPSSAILDAGVITIENNVYIRAELADGNMLPLYRVAPGNNTILTVDSRTQAPLAVVDLAAAAGAGDGRVKQCGPAPYVATINEQAPDSGGRFSIVPSPCLAVDSPLSSSDLDGSPHSVRFQDDCKNCCDCQDFADAGDALEQGARVYQEIGKSLVATKESYVAKLEDWQSRAECAEAHRLRLIMVPQLCPYFDIVAEYCNNSDSCVLNLQFAVTFNLPEDASLSLISAKLLSDRRVSVITDMTSPPTVVFNLASVAKKSKDGIIARFKLPGNGTVAGTNVPLTFSACLTGTIAGEEMIYADQRITVCQNLTLACPADASDFLEPGEVC